ncbi:hypothetical protein QMA06_14560 [Winogradskyella sp. APC 3343]|uniref:Prenyltransferase n=2 Tax=Winogradskyella bathintestinalis TaxID=3035208 RepID=A0ABT7ZYW5_9FLAO|nr:hypothetical protein [Winogradskyella bathintestinalis]
MDMLKRSFNFYLNSSIHVAFAALALVWVTLIELDLLIDKHLLGFVFCATITGYNFVKYFGVAKFHHRSLASWLRVIQIFSLLAFTAMCYFAFFLEVQTLILTGILGIITFFYAIPIMIPKQYLFDDHKNLRQIGGIKVYVIALVWTFASVFSPVVNNEIPIDTEIVVLGVQRFFFILVLMLPFEIRDLNYDSLKLATIPQKIGIKKTKIFGVLLLLLFVMLDGLKEETKLTTILIALISGVLLFFSNKDQSKYYSPFWVESVPILWLISLLLFG